MKTGAVIVAAGMSSRMKAFKPMLKICGSTVIETAISTLRSAGVCEIAVVTGKNAGMLEKQLAPAGVTCLRNSEYETTEMFDSAKIGLNYLKDRCGRIFFLPGDVPLFSRCSLIAMTEEMDLRGCQILMPVFGGKTGHPILIDSAAALSLLNYQGGSGLKGAIDRFDGLKKAIELDDEGMLLDADTPEDYKRLLKYAEKHPQDGSGYSK